MQQLLTIALLLTVVAVPLSGQTGRGVRPSSPLPAPASSLKFHIDEDFFKWPDNIWPSEAVGVALNSKGHIFLLNRGNHPLLEFGPDGSFLRSMGEGSTIFHAAHSVRFDAEDNMWLVDAGNNVVVKFNPKGRIVQALGRRLEPWVYLTHGIERAIPGTGQFPPADRYGVKFTREGTLVRYWGGPGCASRPVQHAAQHRDRLKTQDSKLRTQN